MSSNDITLRSQQFAREGQWRAVEEQGRAYQSLGQMGDRAIQGYMQGQQMAIAQAEADARLQAFEAQRAINQRKLQEAMSLDAARESRLRGDMLEIQKKMMQTEYDRLSQGTQQKERLAEIRARERSYLARDPHAAAVAGFVYGSDGGLKMAETPEEKARLKEMRAAIPKAAETSDARRINALVGLARAMQGDEVNAPQFQKEREELMRAAYDMAKNRMISSTSNPFDIPTGTSTPDMVQFFEQYGEAAAPLAKFSTQFVRPDPGNSPQNTLMSRIESIIAITPNQPNESPGEKRDRVMDHIKRAIELASPEQSDYGPYTSLLRYLRTGAN